jgi:hypothetical protein
MHHNGETEKENERFQIKPLRNKSSTTFLVTGYKNCQLHLQGAFFYP